jgi:type III secretion system SsaH family protein
MTNPLDPKLRRLIAETGIVAANHQLKQQARAIRDALPHLVPEPHDRVLLEAAMLMGMGDLAEALTVLKDQTSESAQMLCQLICLQLAGATSKSVH